MESTKRKKKYRLKPREDRIFTCSHCNVSCWSISQLNNHIIGHKHRKVLFDVCPEMVPLIPSFQHFLDTYLMNEPILGLEYIEEIQEDRYRYKYLCHLCAVETDRHYVIGHITDDLVHSKRYLDRHYPETSANVKQFTDKIKALRTSAAEIIRKHGRKKIQERKPGACGPPLAKVAKYSISSIGLLRWEAGTLESRRIDFSRDPAPSIDTKWNTPSESLEREAVAESEMWGQMNIPQFQHNDGFLDYLRNFDIQNGDDATFVTDITQNCRKALVKFQKRQANAEASLGPLSSSCPAPAHTDRAVAEHKSHSSETVDKSVLSESQCADGSSLESEAMDKSDAAENFFSSIKNMEASEVSKAVEKFAATNPAFKGIDIPNVIRYLQETGRLKII